MNHKAVFLLGILLGIVAAGWLRADAFAQGVPAAAPPPPATGLAACPAATDPPGWFALGPAAPPTRSAVVGRSAAFALDERGDPWMAMVDDDATLRISHLVDDPLTFLPVPGVSGNGTVTLGMRGTEPLLAVADAALTLAEHQGTWRVRKLGWLCKPIQLPQGGQSSPGVAIDHQGEVWQACVEGLRGPYTPPPKGPQLDLFFYDSHPVVAARLHVGRLVGGQWVQLPAKSISAKARAVDLVVVGSGEIQVYLDWQPQVVFRIDPAKRVIAPSPPVAAAPPLAAAPSPLRGLAQRGLRRLGVVGRGDCFYQHCGLALGIADADGPWRPLRGGWSFGVSGEGHPAYAPAIALSRCGDPVVAWNDGTKNMVLRRWDGHDFAALAPVAGDGPHGLAVDSQGDVFIGAWKNVAQHEVWQLTKVHAGTPVELPALAPTANEWIHPIRERTRLSVTSGIRVSYPRSAAAPRDGFVLNHGQWQAASAEDSLLPTATLPYPNQIQPPDFWTPDRVYPTRFAAHSALAFAGDQRPIIAWADDQRLHVTLWNGTQWLSLDEDSLPASVVNGAPAIAATKNRVCVAWSSVAVTPAVFIRCHRNPLP